MRGQRSLYDDYQVPLMAVPKREGIGRNKQLHASRNRRLLYRYYYYIKLLNKSYPYTITQLSLEFDLSEDRVITSIGENSTLLKVIMHEERPAVEQLCILYPWMVW